MKINRDYDIPYAGGYSTDGETIYIDRDIPETFTAYDGRVYSLISPLIYHEKNEYQYLRAHGSFSLAHKQAVDTDINNLEFRDIPIDEYYGHLHVWVLHCLEKYRSGKANLPPDLDLRPYIEDGIIK